MRSRLPQPTVHRLAALAFVAVVALLGILTPVGLLMLSPALALVAVIGLGLFPGEDLILRVRRRLRRRRDHGALRPVGRPAPQAGPARIGRTLAFALAMRPPPALAPIQP